MRTERSLKNLNKPNSKWPSVYKLKKTTDQRSQTSDSKPRSPSKIYPSVGSTVFNLAGKLLPVAAAYSSASS